MKNTAAALALLGFVAAAPVLAETSPEQAAGPEATQAEAAPSGQRALEGVVRARGSRDPLPARIYLTRPDGSRDEAALRTDELGRFELSLPTDATVGLTFSAPGYEPQSLEVSPSSGDRLLIWLDALSPEAVVVTADGAEREHVAATTLPRQMVLQTPGTYDDAVRLVQALPGVVQTAEYSPRAGFIAVRGSGPGDNRFFLDGIDLPYLFHFQQYASVVPTSLLEEVTLYPGTFRPAYGNALGAIVDARTRDFQPEVLRANVNVNLIMAGGAVEAPVGDYGTFAAGGRRSYLDNASANSAEYTVWPIFWDYHVRYDHRLKTGRRLGVFAYGAGDAYERYDLERGEVDPIVEPDLDVVTVGQRFHAVGARCSLGFGQPYTSESVASVVVTNDEAVSAAGPREGLTDRYLYVRHDGVWAGVGKFKLAVGGEVKASSLLYQGDPRGGALAWPEPVLPAPDRATEIKEVRRAWTGLYAEGSYTTQDGLTLKPGLRVDADSYTGAVTADPRLTLLVPLHNNVGLRVAAGLYHQVPDAVLSELAGLADTVRPARAAEVAGGLEMTVSGRMRLHAQGYYKGLDEMLEAAAPGQPVGTLSGVSGGAYGAEASMRYHIRDHFFTWVSYAYARAWRFDPLTGDRYAYDFEQPHNVNVVGSWQPNASWSLGLRYRMSSGLPYTEVDGAIFDAGDQTWQPLPGERNAARLPTYAKADAMIEHKWIFDRWTLSAYLEAWYVLPRGNVLYPLYSYDYSEVQMVGGPVFVPLVGVRGSL